MSSQFTETLKERMALSVGATTTLNSGSTASLSTAGLNMALLRRARAFLVMGATAGTIAFKLQASATSGGSYSDITGYTTNPSMTGLTTAARNYAIEIRADQMPAGKPWVKAIATESTAGDSVVTMVLIGEESSYKPGNQYNVSTITSDLVVG